MYFVNELQRLEVENVETAPELGRVAEIGFSTRDVKAMAEYLRKRDVPMLGPVHDGRFEMRDPEGRAIAFVQEKARATPPEPGAVSRRLIHAGFVVRNRAKEDAFYRDVLGFHLFWEGGMTKENTDWVNMQVPDGSDCVEYMLRQAEHPPVKQFGDYEPCGAGRDEDERRASCVGTQRVQGQRVQRGSCGPGRQGAVESV